MKAFLDIDLDKVNEDYLYLVEIIGGEAFFKLSKEIGGTHVTTKSLQKTNKNIHM